MKHSSFGNYLLAAHALSGCDTVSCLYGIGKTTVLKVLKTGAVLEKLGCLDESMTDIERECVTFMSACYGLKSEHSMTSTRYKLWSSKMGNCKLNAPPELKSLPPTMETFSEHVKRAHLQGVKWKKSLNGKEKPLLPEDFGWRYDEKNSTYFPVALPLGCKAAPDDILKMVKCGCTSERPCSSLRCSCASAHLSCSIFCACGATESCYNKQTKFVRRTEEEGDSVQGKLIK